MERERGLGTGTGETKAGRKGRQRSLEVRVEGQQWDEVRDMMGTEQAQAAKGQTPVA